jgi:hypothetical protein
MIDAHLGITVPMAAVASLVAVARPAALRSLRQILLFAAASNSFSFF